VSQGPQPALVIISEDPRSSHRANEAMRIALGLVAGGNPVSIVLTGPALHLLDIAKFRASLKKLGVPFHVEGDRPPGAWNTETHPVVPVGRGEIAALVPKATRFLVF
jgi:hypothetical protein